MEQFTHNQQLHIHCTVLISITPPLSYFVVAIAEGEKIAMGRRLQIP